MKSKNRHLSVLMFFQLAVLGTYMPIISIYFKDFLGFTALQAGFILSMAALPSVIAPFLSAWVVDRIITSRRFLAISHLVASVILITLSFEKTYISVLITYFILTMIIVPTSALVNAVVFHYMDDREAFGGIRLWGTIGWIFSGWLISFIWKLIPGETNMSLALRLPVLFSTMVIILTLKLPKLKVNKNKKISLIPHEAIDVMKKPEIILLLFLVLVVSTADKFISYGMPMFLTSNGIAKDNLLIIMSLGQLSEIIMLFALSSIVKKLGFKNVLIIGLILETIRYIIFYINGPFPITIFGILIHGFIYAMFYATGTIYLDNFTDEKSRGGVHQLYSLIFVGVAGFLGNLFAGSIIEKTGNSSINFKTYWSIPGIMSLCALTILFIFMKRVNKEDIKKVL